MDKFLSLLIIGLISGGIYALLGAGLVLTYTTTGIFNFGYGAIAFMGAFLFYEFNSGLHWPTWVAGVFVILVLSPLLGLGLDRFIFRRLTRASDASKIMAAVGTLVAVPALVRWIVALCISVGGANIPSGTGVFGPPGIGPTPKTTWHLGANVTFDSNQLIVLCVAVLVAGSLWYLLRKTPLGLRMRALVDRPELAITRGVDRARTSSSAWLIGTLLAGLAGVIAAPIINTLTPTQYLFVLFAAIAGAVIGGFRSVPLAVLGGLLVGALESLVAGYASFASSIPGFSSGVPFIVLLVGIVLFARDRSRLAGAASEVLAIPARAETLLPLWRRLAPWVIGFGVFFIWLFLGADEYWTGLATQGIALSLVFLSFVVVTGMGGIVSLAQAAFVTASGLVAGMLIERYHQNFMVGLLAGVVVAVGLGMVVAIPSLRFGGLALALATLALGFLGDNVLFQWNWLSGLQAEGWTIPRPSLGPFHFADNRTLAVVLVAIVLAVTILIRNLQRSPSGRMMDAVRTSQAAAITSGVSAVRTKLSLFAFSAALAGLGGVLLFTYDTHAAPGTYSTTTGLTWLATVVLWGVRRPGAAVLAGISSALFNGFLAAGVHFSFFTWAGTTSPYLPSVLFGLGAITMAQNPDGILALSAEQQRQRRARRQARRAARLAAAQAAVSVTTQAEQASKPTAAPAREHGPQQVAATVGASHGDEGHRAGAGDLVIAGLDAGYGETQVLFGIDLTVRSGSLTALVGANGAGKSTLCGVLSGLVQATHGSITVDRVDITRVPAHRRIRTVMVAPESRGIFPGLSVDDNLALRLPDAAQRATAYDRFPALANRRRLAAGNLSGGEQQMLTMAPLVVNPPEVLVADEPTLGLAPLIAREILTVLVELRAQGVTLLVVEERARALLEIADHVALLELGRIVWSGPRPELDDELLAAVYLGQVATA